MTQFNSAKNKMPIPHLIRDHWLCAWSENGSTFTHDYSGRTWKLNEGSVPELVDVKPLTNEEMMEQYGKDYIEAAG